MFGDNCCGCGVGNAQFTKLEAVGDQFGFPGFTGSRRFTMFQSQRLHTVTDFSTTPPTSSQVTVRGTLVMDSRNGAIVQHTMDQPSTSPTVTAVPYGAPDFTNVTTLTETSATWSDATVGVYQALTLSGTALTATQAYQQATALLGSVNLSTIPVLGEDYLIAYAQNQFFFMEGLPPSDPSGGVYPTASWTTDFPPQPGWNSVPSVSDHNIPAYAAPVPVLTDRGLTGATFAYTSSAAFYDHSIGWTAGRTMVTGIALGSNHCLHTFFDNGQPEQCTAIAAIQLTPTRIGFIALEPIIIPPASGFGERDIALNASPSATTSGCPCH
jgi:hypothetical protein